MNFQFRHVLPRFSDSYERSVALHRDREFICCVSIRGKTVRRTFGEFDRDVTKVMGFLSGLDFKPDQLVSLAANEYEHLVYITASWRMGVAHCPVNPQETPARVEEKIRQLGGRSLVLPLAGEPGLTLPDSEGSAPQSQPFLGAMCLMFTSGSTGYSKIVPQAEASIMANAECLIDHHQITKDTVICTPLPVFHVNALHFSFLCCLLVGAKLVLLESFLFPQAWEIIEKEKVQILSVVPQIIRHMTKNHRGAKNFNLQTLKYAVSAAAPLSASQALEFTANFGVKIIQGYGLSEAVNFSCVTPVAISDKDYDRFVLKSRYPTIGKALPCNEVALFDKDGSELSVPNTEGELALKGINVMQGYRNESVQKSFLRGYFLTGDTGFFERGSDGEKYFFISGRIKDVIKRSGSTISLREIDELMTLAGPPFTDAVAVPFENTVSGEEFGLMVICESRAGDPERQLGEFLNSRLPAFLRPSVVVFTSEKIRSQSGKALRFELKKYFSEFKDRSMSPQTLFLDCRSESSPGGKS